jgi:hypothetical protein
MSGSRGRGPNAARRRHIKAQLARRDGACCFYCGQAFAALADATIDHLVPHCALRTWVQANLVLACRPCNQAKADRLPQTFLRPSGLGAGLVPLHGGRGRVRTAVRTAVRAVVRSAVRRLSAELSARLSALRAAGLSAGLSALRAARCASTARPTAWGADASCPAGRDASARADGAGRAGRAGLIECGRCGATCRRDHLADEPLRWLVSDRAPLRVAYCWGCVSAICGELVGQVSR